MEAHHAQATAIRRSGDFGTSAVSETRKLAAILVADVVGYSRLAAADEDRTLSRLRGLRSDLFDPAIAAHHGRVVKRTGDGSVIEFRSVVDAVRCAIEVQSGLIERNTGVAPDRRIEYRVGIHLGDVVEEADGDLMGDGVNIAARLEGICEPGGICLSEDAYRQVKGRLDLKVSDLGNTQLENIAEPIRVYLLEVGVPAPPKPSPPASAAEKIVPPRLSLVVLPFANIGGDPEQDYFADGVTESLTTDLAHLSGSFVIARNTAFTYKGKAVDVKEIGRELGVRYALEGSVRRTGEDVTVNAQLISTENGAHVWAERFEGDQLGQLQVEVVARLANALDVALVRAEALRAIRERPNNPDAVDLAMRGWLATMQFSPAGDKEAIEDYERALKLDPNLVRAKIGLASAYAVNVVFGSSTNPRADAERAEKLADEALSEEPDNARAHMMKAFVYQALVLTRGKAPSDPLWEAGIAESDAAVEIDRNAAEAHANSGWYRLFLGRAAEAFPGVETAMRLSPRDPVRRSGNTTFAISTATWRNGNRRSTIVGSPLKVSPTTGMHSWTLFSSTLGSVATPEQRSQSPACSN
jgi:TolB-like protein/class 3 adenylate cyclase